MSVFDTAVKAISSVTPGTGATELGKAEDAGHSSGDVGVMALAVRTDTAATRVGTDGDYAPLEVDANNRLHVVTSADPGAYSTAAMSFCTVTTSSAAALAANADRVYAYFCNDSDTTIYLGIGGDAGVGAGIRLSAAGGTYEMSKRLGNLHLGAVTAVHGGSNTKNLCILEGD